MVETGGGAAHMELAPPITMQPAIAQRFASRTHFAIFVAIRVSFYRRVSPDASDLPFNRQNR
jgi:hypothetical protein